MEWLTKRDVARYRTFIDTVSNSKYNFSNGVNAENLEEARTILRTIYHVPAIPVIEYGEERLIALSEASLHQMKNFWEKEMRTAKLGLSIREKDAHSYGKAQTLPSDKYSKSKKNTPRISLEEALANGDETLVRQACERDGVDFETNYANLFG